MLQVACANGGCFDESTEVSDRSNPVTVTTGAMIATFSDRGMETLDTTPKKRRLPPEREPSRHTVAPRIGAIGP
jgi:hypothetical protein